MADAVNEGLRIRQAVQVEEEVAEEEQYLGAATLAKLRSGLYEFEEEDLGVDVDLDEEVF